MDIIMTCSIRRRTLLASLALFCGAAAAQSFPSGPVTIVVPAPSGSSTDSTARTVADALSKIWGVPVIVDNRPGAGATLGAAAVSKAQPDGQTLLLASTALVQGPYLYKRLPYRLDSFAPVAQIANAPLILAISSETQAKTLPEFTAKARVSGGKYSYASPGVGTTPHLLGKILEKATGIELLHIPYRGTSPAVIDVAGGRVNAIFATYSVVAPQANAGKLRLLGITGTRRSSGAPEIPTMAEAGLKGFEAVGFEGIFVPAKTPRATVGLIADGSSSQPTDAKRARSGHFTD
jgi:tripartite-type tricarboxylate transporter receptor subunit TctC